MRIHLATDHAGFELKEIIKNFLDLNGYTTIDYGPYEFVDGDDYPDYIIPAVESAIQNNELAIVLGGSGQGEAIAANKVLGARAVVFYGGSEDIVRLSRTHNDANVLSLGARFLTEYEVKSSILIWLETKFSNEDRHIRRLKKITNYRN